MAEPIRKRGYYRALKRGETWPLMRKGMLDICRKYAEEMFKPSPLEVMWKENAKFVGLGEILLIQTRSPEETD